MPSVGINATISFELGMCTGYYYFLVYADLSRRCHMIMRCGERIMEVTSETIEKCASLLQEKEIDRKSTDHDVWMVTDLFCAMKNISDGIYPSNDKVSKWKVLQRMWKTNV